MDGKGYPLGKIPSLPASIVGICDVFDASTTLNRRYKIAKGVKEHWTKLIPFRTLNIIRMLFRE